jgi:hypothetical protein
MGFSTARAQNIDFGTTGADQVWSGADAGARAGLWLDRGPVGAGDDRQDLIIGAPGGGSSVGHVYVMHGGPVLQGTHSLAESDVIFTGGAAGDEFGRSTATGRVLASTGPRDLLIGAPGAQSNRGRVYLFRGGLGHNQTFGVADAAYTVTGAPEDRIGSHVALGDLNGDGRRELIIGAPGNNRIYVIHGGNLAGSRDLSTVAADVTISGPGIGGIFVSGDVSNDGAADILIGAPTQAGTAGQAYVVYGRSFPAASVLTLPAASDIVFTGIDAADVAGTSVRIGDLNGDSLNEIIIGAPGGDGPGNSRTDAGEVYVLWGRRATDPRIPSMTLSQAELLFTGSFTGYRLGTWIDSSDINRDAPDDLLMLTPGANSGLGMVQVIYGRSRSSFGSHFDIANGFDRGLWGTGVDGVIATMVGFEISGEGALDIIVGIPTADSSSGVDAGKVFFSLSPKLRIAGPLTIPMSAGLGRAASRTVVVENPGAGVVPWSVTTGSSWLSYSPSTGESSNGFPSRFTLTASAASLPIGTHTSAVRVKSETRNLIMTVVAQVSFTVTTEVSRNPDVDGDGVPESTPVPPRIALGLDRYIAAQGGWMATRAGSSHAYGTTAWLRVPKADVGAAGGETHVAAGDIDGDGLDELVVGMGREGKGMVAVLDDDAHGHALLAFIDSGWEYYSNTFGTIYPAVGNLDGDAAAEIVMGLGPGGSGWFKVIDDASTGFAAYGWYQTSWAGYAGRSDAVIHPAIGDLDGNGQGEIVLGFGTGSQGWVEVRHGAAGNFGSRMWFQGTWAGYNAAPGGGITWPAVGNLDADARAEIVLGLGPGSAGWLDIRDDLTAGFASLKWVNTGWSAYESANGETRPAVGNVDADAGGEIVIGLSKWNGSGGWILIRDGAAGNYAPIIWKQLGWVGYDGAGGGVQPTVGRFR